MTVDAELHAAAATLTPPLMEVPAFDALLRRRRHRRNGMFVAAFVVAMIATVGLVAGTDHGGSPPHVATGSEGSSVPPVTKAAGSSTVVAPTGAGVTLRIPPGWHEFDAAPLGLSQTVLEVGDADAAVGNWLVTTCAPTNDGTTPPSTSAPVLTGTWILLLEYPTVAADPQQVREPFLPGFGSFPVGDRPLDFTRPEGDSHVTMGCGTALLFDDFFFRDAGRTFLAKLMTTNGSNNLPSARQILNSLRVSPTPTEPTTTTAPSGGTR
jgi:hypothetical protein